jgi:autotransporter-associated beta strand protein
MGTYRRPSASWASNKKQTANYQNPKTRMKNTPRLLRYLSATALAAVFLATSPLQAATFTWDGGDPTGNSWGTANNWTPDGAPTFNNTADLIFDNLTRPDHYLGNPRTVRSITYGANIDGAFNTNFLNFNGGTAAALTMDTDVVGGNATITINADATGNISMGWNGLGGVGGGALALADNLVVTHNGSGEFLINRQITGSGFGFTKNGTGTMRVASGNANTFSGAVNVDAGRLIMASTSAAGADLNTASALNLGGGILEMRTTSALNKTITPNMTVSSASTLAYNNTTGTTQSLTLSTGSMALNADLTVQNISTGTTLTNQILINRAMTGTGDLIVDGYNTFTSGTSDFAAGRVALGGNNSGWSGDLVIREGSAQIFGDTAVGAFSAGTGGVIIGETGNSAGAAFLLAASTPTAGAKTLSNDIIVRSGGFRTIRGGSDHTYNINGNITLEGDLNVHNGLFFTDKNMILNGNISGVGGLSITESGNPNFTRLTGNNTYSGATSIGTGAVLNILSTSGNAIGDSSAVTFAGAGATLVFNSTNETVGSIASSGTDGAINLGANTLTTGGNNASTSYGGNINGTGGLTKTGSGTLTLTGSNTYTGRTTVSQGTLLLTSTATLSSTDIQVSTGAALDASALVGGLTIASGNRIGGDGTFTGDLNLAAGANLIFSLTSTFDVTGAVSLDNGFSINSLVNADGSAINWALVGEDTYSLIGTTTSDFSNISNFGLANAANVGGGKLAYFANGSLDLIVIPEPSTGMLLLGGFGFLALLRRKSS